MKTKQNAVPEWSNRSPRCPNFNWGKETNMLTSRRRCLQTSLSTSAFLSTSAAVPLLMSRTAAAAAQAKRGEKILVVVQLSGGNDGLNTVVPFADDQYGKNRIALKIEPSTVLKLDDQV